MSFFAADPVWDMSPIDMGVFEGRSAIRGALKAWWEMFPRVVSELDEVLDLGNGVVLQVVTQRGRPADSSSELRQRSARVFIVVDGLIEALTSYNEIDEARAAAETLSEERGYATSRKNVELVEQLYAWLADGEDEKAFDVYASEIEWDSRAAPWLMQLGSHGIYRGHDGVRAALRDWLGAWESISYLPTEMIDAGDDVLALVHVAARGRASGVEVSYDHGQLWTLRDGLVVRMGVFADHGEALRAAGLSQ